jgi:hypothetical protein
LEVKWKIAVWRLKEELPVQFLETERRIEKVKLEHQLERQPEPLPLLPLSFPLWNSTSGGGKLPGSRSRRLNQYLLTPL